MNTRINLSKEAKELLDEFVASRERWFGNSTDYKTWDSICKVLWRDEDIMQGDSHDNSWVAFLEYLAEFSVSKNDSIPNEKVKKMFEELNARSGWEMLPAKVFRNSDTDYVYTQGAREMEKIWHEILEEKKKQLLGEKI